MCKPDPLQLDALVRQAVEGTAALVAAAASPPRRPPLQGSRRRRLWELDGHAHCPVLGVCLPMHVLRRLLNKALRGEAQADDYELHCGAVAECKTRTPVAEAVQRELDHRYGVAVRQAALAKTPEALAAWWDDALLRRQDIAGPLWAALTHPRCTPELACRIEGQVHMLQHQSNMAARVDSDRFEALLQENALLSRELGGAQQRCMRQATNHARRADELQEQILSLRARLIVRDTVIAGLREELQTLEAAVPGLKSRLELARANQRLIERVHQTERARLQAQHEVERQRRHADELAAELRRRPERLEPPACEGSDRADELLARLDDQAVLCVGGRPASVPVYRQLIERTGGRFLHHDGGDEDSVAKLDATLAAADLVICQTGCVSHDAYWRVKDHCKRTGKRCVFVESPSGAGLKRALLTLVPAPVGEAGRS